MKIKRKPAYFNGYWIHKGERFNEWSCPNKRCGMHVAEDYAFCPYCGQRLMFKVPEKVKYLTNERKAVMDTGWKDRDIPVTAKR